MKFKQEISYLKNVFYFIKFILSSYKHKLLLKIFPYKFVLI